MRQDWSKEVYEMMAQLDPYFKPDGGGVRDDSPAEIKVLFKRFCEQVEKERWK